MNYANVKITLETDLRDTAQKTLNHERRKIAKMGDKMFVSNPRIHRLALDETTKVEITTISCEKCGRNTFFSVKVNDRRAAWCGCE